MSNTIRVLLVEDNQGDVELVRKALARLSRRPSAPLSTDFAAVPHGRACLQHLASDTPPPDVIVTDLNMPVMGGLEVLAELREHPTWSLIPKVVLTSSSAPEDVTAAYRLNAAACFEKPLGSYRALMHRILEFVSAASRPTLALAEPRGENEREEIVLLRRVLELTPSPLLLLDEAGLITSTNEAAQRLFGWQGEPPTGRPLEELVRVPAGVDLRPAWQHATPLLGMELTGIHRDGSEFPLELSLLPAASEATSCTMGSVVDLRDRQLAEARLETAVEAAPCGILMANRDGDILLVNRELERIFGYARGELLGASVEQLLPESVRGSHVAMRQAFLTHPERRSMGFGRDLHGQRKDGTEFPIEVGLNPTKTKDGVVVLGTVVDITRRRQLEEEQAQQRRELERSNQDLQQFARAASHDLQEPLRMVSAFTELLAEHLGDDLDEDAQRYIHFAQDGVERMRGLIDGVLSLSRVRTEGAEAVPVDVLQCVREAMLDLGPRIAESGASVEVDVPADLRALGDAAQLRSLFVNLIGNALKYRRDEAPEVRVQAAAKGPLLALSVSDNGIGIPEEHAERVFGLFERMHPRDAYPGAGIGLALCRRVVERHGGTIEVESDGESGSTFRFTLERAPA